MSVRRSPGFLYGRSSPFVIQRSMVRRPLPTRTAALSMEIRRSSDGLWHVGVNAFEPHATTKPVTEEGVGRLLQEWGVEVDRWASWLDSDLWAMRRLRPHRAQLPPGDDFADSDWWPDRTLIPSTDAACRAVLDRALTCLILVRGGAPHDPGARISTLVSLIADADARLPDAVADARHQGYTWHRIAERLGSTVPAARHRFASYARRCRQLRLFA